MNMWGAVPCGICSLETGSDVWDLSREVHHQKREELEAKRLEANYSIIIKSKVKVYQNYILYLKIITLILKSLSLLYSFKVQGVYSIYVVCVFFFKASYLENVFSMLYAWSNIQISHLFYFLILSIMNGLTEWVCLSPDSCLTYPE